MLLGKYHVYTFHYLYKSSATVLRGFVNETACTYLNVPRPPSWIYRLKLTK